MDEGIVVRVRTAQRYGSGANRVDGQLIACAHASGAVQAVRHDGCRGPNSAPLFATLSGQSRYARLRGQSSTARVAESVDAEDSKSSTTRVVYEFESRPGHDHAR